MSRTDPIPGSLESTPPYQGVRSTPVTGWAAWIFFATFMLVLLGILHAITGLVALFRDQYFVVESNGLVVTADYTVWGWVHLGAGLIMVAAGVSLLTGHLWARIVAALVAMASAVVNFSFLAAYPFWSTIMITLDVLVIWAVIVHGTEMKDA
ncbi:hypothetical protein [Aeromicrobium sp. IC_218]|uniref:DUF7144 family membrane protein n=1 Tax=Aeromicrobium sp. IC_218 TaxID=2545468 RepID=UPI001A954464|nr:hypothetical protein [Aeromicrobium sp. IC_218]